MNIDYHYRIVPLLISLEECGDLVYISDDDLYFRFSVIDGLGHGHRAHEAASKSVEFLKLNPPENPGETIKLLHDHIKGTIGAVMALGVLNKKSGILKYSGIGNICTRSIGKSSISFIPRDGVVGESIPNPEIMEYRLGEGDIIVLYSDGMKERFDLFENPGLEHESAKTITNTLIEKYSKSDDDVSLLTIKVE